MMLEATDAADMRQSSVEFDDKLAGETASVQFRLVINSFIHTHMQQVKDFLSDMCILSTLRCICALGCAAAVTADTLCVRL